MLDRCRAITNICKDGVFVHAASRNINKLIYRTCVLALFKKIQWLDTIERNDSEQKGTSTSSP